MRYPTQNTAIEAPPAVLLAHLSDIHLPHARPPGLREINAKRLLGWANWRRNRVHVHTHGMLERIVADLRAQATDHIVVTGDLVNFGLPAEHAAALEWLRRLGPPDRVTVVPGNHDAYVRPRADAGIERWREYMTSGGQDIGSTGAPAAATRGGFPFVRRHGDVALIGVCSGVPTPLFMSAGRVGAVQADALARLLAGCRAAGLARVVLIHHPPRAYAQAWRTGLSDWRRLRGVVRAEGAELILHGHFHRHLRASIDGLTRAAPVIGVPSASAAVAHKGDLAGYALYRLGLDGQQPTIELVRRGLRRPGGDIVEIERRML